MGNRGIAPGILNLLRFMQMSSLPHAPGTHCIGGWVGPRASLDAVAKRDVSASGRNANP
jgi:hypothetical protein